MPQTRTVAATPRTRDRLGDGLPGAIRDPAPILAALSAGVPLTPADRDQVVAEASAWVAQVRSAKDPGMMEAFLSEYGLSSREGVALMCLAEALLRVPDAATIDRLIVDKIAPSDWGRHLGHSASSLVNASTWGLLLTGQVLKREEAGLVATLQGLVRRLGEPVIRTAVAQAMRVLGQQFVLGQTIGDAMARAAPWEAQGVTFSYDMLGEAARTRADADRYAQAYAAAIGQIRRATRTGGPLDQPGISIKLSALHPRYEETQADRVMAELVPVVRHLALEAARVGIGLTIDAEEQDRLALSLDVIEAVLATPDLAGWDGFGVVVQAYGLRAPAVIDTLYSLATRLDRRIPVRLVKGAYWDQEVKRAQTLGLDGFPVFTTKAATDVSYLGCAAAILRKGDRLIGQFATHNAHTVAAILALAEGRDDGFELQRLHGMGDTLHTIVRGERRTRLRVYAPVGAHEDLLAYLVRRLLENGANSSFVNQIVDPTVPVATITRDPFAKLAAIGSRHPTLAAGPAVFAPTRRNASGWDWTDRRVWQRVTAARRPWQHHRWSARPMLARPEPIGPGRVVTNPADPTDDVGSVITTPVEAIEPAVQAATAAVPGWAGMSVDARAAILSRAATLIEQNAAELFALLAREAGKTPPDAVNEVREAVDFLHYYSAQAAAVPHRPRGVFACISPWNFPLAIFLGQVSAALVTGNTVLAKPAEQTPLIAARAVELLHQAGVPTDVLQLLPGAGPVVGAALAAHPGVSGVCFTGSTATAKRIDHAIALTGQPDAPLIAETGGLNAMIVDSTALPEQAVRDIVASSFQSAGQRCSALRLLYVQADVAPKLLTMLKGAMAALVIGDPWSTATDVGPVIDAMARDRILAYIEAARAEGRLLYQGDRPAHGMFVPPTLLSVQGISDLAEEVFGPILHIATFKSGDLDAVVSAINAKGFGLTFGLHSRIDDRVQSVTGAIRVGNAYVNRNQIGAVVGSQPFGGEGLSGTGPKAGGPHYLSAFVTPPTAPLSASSLSVGHAGTAITRDQVIAALNALPPIDLAHRIVVDLPGPTGESNRLTTLPRGVVLCLGPSVDEATAQAAEALAAGCVCVMAAAGATSDDARAVALDGVMPPGLLVDLPVDLVMCWSDPQRQRVIRQSLAVRPGPIIPLVGGPGAHARLIRERHLCIDTTAAGGNTQLLAMSD